MEWKRLKEGEALPPPPEGEEKEFRIPGHYRLLVLCHAWCGPYYDVMVWDQVRWRPLVCATPADGSILAYAFLRPDKILDGLNSSLTGSQSDDLSEARGEVGGKGDRVAEQSAAQENEDLRPCPFCGEPGYMTRYADRGVTGECLSNLCQMTQGLPLERWNNRPIEDRLRAELTSSERLLTLYTTALAWHEDNNFRKSQQLAEEKQYNAELEKRLKEAGGKWVDSTVHIPDAWDGSTLVQVPYDQAIDRAQVRAEVEHETANRIADWLEQEGYLIRADLVRNGAYRGTEQEDGELPSCAMTEEDLERQQADSGDWEWAREMVAALIRWSLNLDPTPTLPVQAVRHGLVGLLDNIEHLEREAKR